MFLLFNIQPKQHSVSEYKCQTVQQFFFNFKYKIFLSVHFLLLRIFVLSDIVWNENSE